MAEEQILPITKDWAVILVENKPSEGLLLGKASIRTVLDPLHKALFNRLMLANNMLNQVIQEKNANANN